MQPDKKLAANTNKESVSTGVLKTAAISYGIRQILITALGLGSNIVLTRILMPKEYGVIAIIMMIVSLGTILADGGLGVYLIQRKEEIDDRDISEIVNVQLVAALSFVAVIFIVALCNQLFFPRHEVYWLLAFSSLSIPLTVVRGMALLRLERVVKMGKIAVVDILEQFIYMLVAVYFAYKGAGAASIVIAMIVKSIAGCIISLTVAPWHHLFVFPKLTKEFKVGIKFALHYQGAQLINIARGSITPTFINGFLGFTNGGYVERASFINSTPAGLISIIQGRVFFPFSSRIRDDKARLIRFLEDSIYLNSVIDKIFYLPLLIFTHETVVIVFSTKWQPIVPLLQMLMINTLLFGALAGPLYPVINALGASNIIFRLNLVTMFVSWGLMVPLCMLYGINGVGYAVPWLWLGVLWLKKELQKHIGPFVFFGSIAKPTLAAVISFVLIFALKKYFSYSPLGVVELMTCLVLTIIIFLLILFAVDRERVSHFINVILFNKNKVGYANDNE